MKKTVIKIGAVLLILTVIFGIVVMGLVAFAEKNIDYELDEMLFEGAKCDTAATYYAYDKDGELTEVYKSLNGTSKREWVHLDEVGHYLKNGFLAVEDREFYSHKGINVRRTLGAVLNYIFKFRDSFGASTVTQQVIKNISGDNQSTVMRKINEIFRAIRLERNHSKDEILELYLNIVPMSDNMYGVAIAAERYFGKESFELSIAEAATIIGITNAPTRYNPYLHPDACQEKRNAVLKAMYDCSVISESEYESARGEELKLIKYVPSDESLWFIDTAKKDIIVDIMQKYGITESAAAIMLHGSRIVLTMNPVIQGILDEFFKNKSNLSEKINDGLNYSMVITEPSTGNLLGVIGNVYNKGERMLYNYATAPITPGSVIKPLSIYAPLVESGDINMASMLEDAPVRYVGDVPYPRNTPDVYEGMIDVKDALKKSKNTIAVRLYERLGADRIYKILKDDYGWKGLVESEVTSDGRVISDLAEAPLALGQLSRGVSLRTLTESYNVFPSGGILRKGKSYYSVLDKNGETIVSAESSEKRVMKSDTAKIMNQMLSCVVEDGTARQIKLKESVDTAGKTGTSGGDRDRLFIGYTPYYTAGIWTGYSDGKEVGRNTPNHIEIWDGVMEKIHEQTVFKNNYDDILGFDTSGLTVQHFCKMSGMIPGDNCELDDENVIDFGYFTSDNIPNEICRYH